MREAGVREVGVREVGVREVGMREVGVREVGVREAGVREGSVCRHGRPELALPLVKWVTLLGIRKGNFHPMAPTNSVTHTCTGSPSTGPTLKLVLSSSHEENVFTRMACMCL